MGFEDDIFLTNFTISD